MIFLDYKSISKAKSNMKPKFPVHHDITTYRSTDGPKERPSLLYTMQLRQIFFIFDIKNGRNIIICYLQAMHVG